MKTHECPMQTRAKLLVDCLTKAGVAIGRPNIAQAETILEFRDIVQAALFDETPPTPAKIRADIRKAASVTNGTIR